MQKAIKALLHARGWSYSVYPPALVERPDLVFAAPLELLVRHVAGDDPRGMTFLQVGGFDGATHDELSPLVKAYGWRGVIVEPQRVALERCQSLYSGQPQVSFVGAAIGESSGEASMHVPEGDDASPIASFNKRHVEQHLRNAGRSLATREIKVPVKRINDILEEAGGLEPDIVQIDCEGYDDQVVGQIRLDGSPPRLLRYESRHLDRAVQNRLLNRLAAVGYRFVIDSTDTTAVRVGAGC